MYEITAQIAREKYPKQHEKQIKYGTAGLRTK